MASPLNRRTDLQDEEFDIDALFASEPDEAPEPRRPDPPTLIFTQPADRNVQQFADEPVPFAEETDPLSVPLLPSPEHPYNPRWNEPELPKRGRPGVVLGVLGFLAVLAAAAALHAPRERVDVASNVSPSAAAAALPPPVAPD